MYGQARQLFLAGQLEQSQKAAEQGYLRFRTSNPHWASQFRLLQAQSMLFRGSYSETLNLLAAFQPSANDPGEVVEMLTIEAVSLAHIEQFPAANADLAKADALCARAASDACGEVLRAHGIVAMDRGQITDARQFFLDSLSFAHAHHDRGLESSAWLNLGTVSLQGNHYDEAVDWSRDAYMASLNLGNQNRAQAALGNLGWAYFELGDLDRALPLFIKAEEGAAKLGNVRDQLRWITTSGVVYQDSGDFARAVEAYRESLKLARQTNSKEDILNSLESLAHASIQMGRLDDASGYVDQLLPLVRATESRLDDLDVALAQGRIAAARGQDAQAESIFLMVESDPASQTSMRLDAEHEVARLDERSGDLASADRMYATALATFEQARRQLQNEDSKLPFLANAAPIYDDYISLLVKQGRVDEALALADHSRARTLAQGLGLATPVQPPPLPLGQIARKAGATLLFYWLGPTQSYLWAITPQKTTLFTLPSEAEIARLASRYRNALLGPDDPLQSDPLQSGPLASANPASANPASANPDGLALYRALVEPAAGLIRPGSNVVILGDGVLTQLNFETLIAPAPRPHYWIEDANVIAAPSLYMLASAKSSDVAARNVLLLGDALSPDPDYPALPKASEEMREIERHFAAPQETVLTGPGANPEAYLASAPQQFAYIHFVAHGVASLTDPLDSAIILSPSDTGEDSFKLYARAIIQHPLHARLVTISSCYGGGTRSYAGEGLVGLSWAFLRAGAHNVIGALWEVSDDSTPALMDSLYKGLEQGLPPSTALRRAKLELLHEHPEFRSPFFWAPFQIYTGL